MSDPRTELRDRIADKLRWLVCEHNDRISACGDCLADEAMDLFPEVRTEQVVPFRGASVHTVIAARTAPEPIKEDDRG